MHDDPGSIRKQAIMAEMSQPQGPGWNGEEGLTQIAYQRGRLSSKLPGRKQQRIAI